MRRAGRQIVSQVRLPSYGEANRYLIPRTFPVLEKLELRRVTIGQDRQFPRLREGHSLYLPRTFPQFDLKELTRFPIGQDRQRPMADVIRWVNPSNFLVTAIVEAPEIDRWFLTSDWSPLRPTISGIRGIQIPDPVAPTDTLEIRRFLPGSDRQKFATNTWAYWNLPRPRVTRNARFINPLQPYQPRIFPSNRSVGGGHFNQTAAIPVQLRKFVTNWPLRPRYAEASGIRGVQIPNPAAPGTEILEYRFLTGVDRQRPFANIWHWSRFTIPTNADLYSVRKMVPMRTDHYFYFKKIADFYRRNAPFFVTPIPIPIELFRVYLTADRQPVQRAEPSFWRPQIIIPVALPMELVHQVTGADPFAHSGNFALVVLHQSEPLNPATPVELQQFLETASRQRLPENLSLLRRRNFDAPGPMEHELRKFIVGVGRATIIIPQSMLRMPMPVELTPMPVELRHFIETAFQRYRLHYLVLRGQFEPAPVPNVEVTYKYYQGYTVLVKKLRVN